MGSPYSLLNLKDTNKAQNNSVLKNVCNLVSHSELNTKILQKIILRINDSV